MNNTQIAQKNIKKNLIETRSYFVDNNLPDYSFIEMIDFAIKHWETDKRLTALAILADKEQELISSGVIIDEERGANDSGYFVELYDYLSELEDKELGIETLGELGRASRAERQKKREERQKKRKEIVDKFKKKITKKVDKYKDNREDRKDNRDERRDERKDNRDERRDERKDKHKDRLHKINKYNPVFVGMRNAFRALIALNPKLA